VLVDAIHPGLHSFKRLLIRQIKRYYHSVSLSVELVSDSFESFLSSRVPDLNVELLISFLVFALDEVHTYNYQIQIYIYLLF